MGLLDGHFYLFETGGFNGLRVAKEKLYTDSSTASVDLLSAEEVNSNWSLRLPNVFKSSNASGILLKVKKSNKLLIVVFSAEKDLVVFGTLSGKADDSDGMVHRASAHARGTFFSVESADGDKVYAHQIAVYDSASGVLTFTHLGYLIGLNKEM